MDGDGHSGVTASRMDRDGHSGVTASETDGDGLGGDKPSDTDRRWMVSLSSGYLEPELGKPMRNCYSLPGPDFTYGIYVHQRDGGVPEAIGHWDSVKAKPHKRVMPRDFVAMGRAAVDEGCTTARDFALYYKYRDIRCKDKGILRYGGKVPPGMTFGKPPRPSTPFFDLMQHRYKELWMEEQRARTVVQHVVKKKVGEVRENRTTFLRTHPLPVKEESFWHLQRFEKVEPHLRTFPDPESRKKALSASR